MLAVGILLPQVPKPGGGGGGTVSATGAAANDVACYTTGTNVGPCSTGTLTVVGGALTLVKQADTASAATITVDSGNSVVITGTVTITALNTCNAANAGRFVLLTFADALTVTDGSNLLLAGNFSTTANDTLFLWCDATNWREISRSVN